MSENSKLYTNVRDGRMSVSFFKRENITDKGEVAAEPNFQNKLVAGLDKGRARVKEILSKIKADQSGDFRPTGGSFAIVRADGKIDYVQKCWIEGDCDFIAEYPTWQEAVNSKEFKGE